MKSQCPHCKSLHTIPDAYKEKSIKCPGCAKSFTAKPYLDEIVNQIKPDPVKPKKHKEYIDKPGFNYYIFGVIIGLIGIAAGAINENGIIAFMGFFYMMISCGIGGLLNRAERTAHHTEQMRNEQKNKN